MVDVGIQVIFEFLQSADLDIVQPVNDVNVVESTDVRSEQRQEQLDD